MEQLPSNSHKSQEARTASGEPVSNKPPVPEFQGEIAGMKRKKKASIGKWLRKMFLSDQKPSEILQNVLENQIVPGLKDNFRNSLVSSVDMFIYKNAKTASNNSASNNIGYSKIYNSSSTAVKTQTQAQQPSNAPDLSNGFTNPCFTSKMDADRFLTMMKEYDYPTLSVHTLYMMRKQHIDYTWDAYGWTKDEIGNVKVVHINNPDYPWMIDLPPAHVIS